jgi:hypothetical protein
MTKKQESTNAAIMSRSLAKRGYIRFNVQARIKHPETGNYVGHQGSAITIDAPSVEKADKFMVLLRATICQLALKHGLAIPHSVVVEK